MLKSIFFFFLFPNCVLPPRRGGVCWQNSAHFVFHLRTNRTPHLHRQLKHNEDAYRFAGGGGLTSSLMDASDLATNLRQADLIQLTGLFPWQFFGSVLPLTAL